MITLWRIIQTGFRNFLRNAWLSTAATAVMTITLILMTFSYISNSALRSTIKSVTDKIDVSVYLNDSIAADQLTGLESSIKSDPNVKSLTYISKTQALATYRQENTGNARLLQALSETDNPLPASLQIKVKDPNNLASVAAIISRPDNKALQSDVPSYSGDRKATVDRIVHFSNFFQKTTLVASIIFVIVSILIIFNTIRMAIFTRRNEIEIMQLVGATNWFIRGPFLMEAALYGIIAAALALVFCYSLLLVGASKLGAYVDITSTVHIFKAYPLVVTLFEALIGVCIGVLASIFAMSRHLKL